MNAVGIDVSKDTNMMKIHLISLIALTIPEVNTFFASALRKENSHEKWVDFVLYF